MYNYIITLLETDNEEEEVIDNISIVGHCEHAESFCYHLKSKFSLEDVLQHLKNFGYKNVSVNEMVIKHKD